MPTWPLTRRHVWARSQALLTAGQDLVIPRYQIENGWAGDVREMLKDLPAWKLKSEGPHFVVLVRQVAVVAAEKQHDHA